MSSVGKGASIMMSQKLQALRPGPVLGGKRGSYTTVHSDVPCTNLLPVSSDIAVRMPDRVANELLQVFVPGNYEILEGDQIVLEDSSYPVRASDVWPLRGKSIRLLILDAAKVTDV